ncbi:MAG: hypothetical protein NNA21_01475 [Nitrospira sp.]|nr:hypothetical protein [Nitrospira sp.]MCP9462930.1 hypothetical protein [Nitrospira sp.]MCP9474007.1 hypothetical protein [Nitrospira sp.]
MLAWPRPDPLTRDLIHLINARRHDHGDNDDAVDTLQAFLEQGREHDLLTVLAALDEEMAEWLFDLVAEASCTLVLDGPDDKPSYAVMAALGLPLQANLTSPLKLKIDPIKTAELLHRYLRIPAGTVVRVEPRLLTDATLELLNLQSLHEHLATVAESRRAQTVAPRLLPPVENTAFLLFQLIGAPDPGLPDAWEHHHRRAVLEGLMEQCPELAEAPDTIEAPVYAAYAMFDAQNAVRLHHLADETAAVWRELDPLVRSRTIVHLHTQCGNGVYMPVWTDLFDPELPEEHGPVWTSSDVWVFTADLPIEWPGEMLTNRLLAEGCTRFENHIVETPEN